MTDKAPPQYSRICWYDLVGEEQHSRWYPGTEKTEQALAACRVRWPGMKMWIETGYPLNNVELTLEEWLS